MIAAAVWLWLGKTGVLRRRIAGCLAFLCLAGGGALLAAAVLPFGNVYGPVVTSLQELPALAPGMAPEVPGQASEWQKPRIALTFDDGPYPPYTARLLDVLKEKKVCASFFLVASQAQRYPGLVRRMVRDGHTVGLHAYEHRDFLRLNGQEKKADLTRGKAILTELTGKPPVFWRPPHGFRDPSVMAEAKRQGLTVVNWSVIPRDWTGIDSGTIQERVLAQAEPGAIVLLHDGDSPFYRASRQATVEAVPLLIDALREKGYDLVSLDGRQQVTGYEVRQKK